MLVYAVKVTGTFHQVLLVEWKIPACVNIGALALVWIKFRDQYYSLTDVMFRDMELAAKLMSYNPFWANTQLEVRKILPMACSSLFQ